MVKKRISLFGTGIIICLLFALSGCEDDRATSVTGPQASVTTGGITFTIQLDKTKIGLSDTFSLSLTATCNACFNGDVQSSYNFVYSSNGKISPDSDSKSVTVSSGKVASTLAVIFSGITATTRGTASIIGTFDGSQSETVEVSIE